MTDDQRHIVRLTSVPTEREAAVLVAALETEGITSSMTGQATAGFRAEAPGWVQVLVFEDDLPAARQVLSSESEAGESVDWSQVDVGEPEDPSEASRPATHLMSRTTVAFIAGLIIAILLVMWAF
jgi:hypothetical protein